MYYEVYLPLCMCVHVHWGGMIRNIEPLAYWFHWRIISPETSTPNLVGYRMKEIRDFAKDPGEERWNQITNWGRCKGSLIKESGAMSACTFLLKHHRKSISTNLASLQALGSSLTCSEMENRQVISSLSWSVGRKKLFFFWSFRGREERKTSVPEDFLVREMNFYPTHLVLQGWGIAIL